MSPTAVIKPKTSEPKSGAEVDLSPSRFMECVQDWVTLNNKSGAIYESVAQAATQMAIIAAAALAKAFAFNIFSHPPITSFVFVSKAKHPKEWHQLKSPVQIILPKY